PAATAVTVRSVPRSTAGRLPPISPGASPRSFVSPRPSRPLPLTPQHLSRALSRIAHVWEKPAETAVAVRPEPSGTRPRYEPISRAPSPRLASSASPSCPPLLNPQQRTCPSDAPVVV